MSGRAPRFSFWSKCVVAAILSTAADTLYRDFRIGSWLGALALTWVAALVIARPALLRGPARIAIATAMGFALVLLDGPGLLAWTLFWTALSSAALLPRTRHFDDAWRWAGRLGLHAISSAVAPLRDLHRLLHSRRDNGRVTARSLVTILALPVTGSALFVALFASANPLIDRALSDIRLASPTEIAFWLLALAIVWPSLRPATWTTRSGRGSDAGIRLRRVSLPSLLISLFAFNAIFAVQNGLDIAFLWSGAPLPQGVTLANYAHRGAYPLIATALLAALFVLATLTPGSRTAAHPMLRRLVVLWIAQNVLLVASSILRTCDYIAVYMLTAWRIAALAWMGLVALGLMLVCWRMLAHRSARWLINTNALAAALLLTAGSVVDLDAVAAEWNVRHAREAGGRGVPLDLCQLGQSGASALIPLIELERRPLPADFLDRVRAVREGILANGAAGSGLEYAQANWRTWTWRRARRLARARAMLGVNPVQPTELPPGSRRGCDGYTYKLPAAAEPLGTY